MRCEYATDDGSYVLGALTPAERATYERHLATCLGCRDGVAELAVLPGLLARLDPVTAERVSREAGAVEASRLPRLLRAAEESQHRVRVRRRRQTWGIAATAACLTFLASLGITIWQQRSQPAAERPSIAGPSVTPSPVAVDRPPGTMAMAPMVAGDVESSVTAEVAVVDIKGGAKVWMHCAYPVTAEHHKPYPFWLVAVSTDGSYESLGSWEAGPGEDLWLDGLTRYPTGKLDRLELRSTRGTLLVYQLP